MGLLDQIVGGLVGRGMPGAGGNPAAGGGAVVAALLPVVLQMLANRGGGGGAGAGGLGGLGSLGGLGGLLEQFAHHGYGEQAQSWVGTGENQPVPPEAVSKVLGPDRIAEMAARTGLGEDEVRGGLAQLLPQVVDHLTPGGSVPPQQELLSGVDDFMRRLGQ